MTAASAITHHAELAMGDLYRLVRQIPPGKVASYGWLGRQLGLSARLVGRYLHHNPDPTQTPCHRVVHADGTLADGYAFGGRSVQRQLLVKEGVLFVKERVTRSAFLDGTQH